MDQDIHEKHVIGHCSKKYSSGQLTILDMILLKMIQHHDSGFNLTVLFVTFYSILSSEWIGKRVQNNFLKVYWENDICMSYTLL